MFRLFGKGKKGGKAPSREVLIKQAQENAAKARAEIGEENIRKMADALTRMNDPEYQSAGKAAREEIRNMDKGHIADNLKIFLDEK